ncbi:MAG: hypothetical protein SFY70_01775 [Bacteroidia bacterium]|nr:hypothetical protein [Bacteroidia bacterium]
MINNPYIRQAGIVQLPNRQRMITVPLARTAGQRTVSIPRDEVVLKNFVVGIAMPPVAYGTDPALNDPANAITPALAELRNLYLRLTKNQNTFQDAINLLDLVPGNGIDRGTVRLFSRPLAIDLNDCQILYAQAPLNLDRSINLAFYIVSPIEAAIHNATTLVEIRRMLQGHPILAPDGQTYTADQLSNSQLLDVLG